MRLSRLIFVTGKGGVGKTTVAAALGRRIAADGRRALVVEMAADRGLAALFGRDELPTEPAPLADRLDGMRVETQALLETYFRRLLRLPFLARRLFASNTFHAVTAAAPGVMEFLILERLAQWTAPGWLGRHAPYDAVVVDGPASGHALRLLRTPRQLAALVPQGPLSSTVHRLRALVDDHDHTSVLFVTIPDEMAVTETIEAREAVAGLGLHLARPVLNRVWPRRFDAADVEAIVALRRRGDVPLLAAAGLQIAARREAERHLHRLRQAFGVTPLPIHEVSRNAIDGAALDSMGQALARGLRAAVGADGQA